MRLKNKRCLFSAAGKWTEVFIWLRMDSKKQENAYSVERWTSIFRCTKSSWQGLKKPEWIQATPWPESGADRAAPSREKQVPFFAQGKGFRENQKSFLLFVKDRQENSGYADKMLDAFQRFRIQLQGNIYICMLVFWMRWKRGTPIIKKWRATRKGSLRTKKTTGRWKAWNCCIYPTCISGNDWWRFPCWRIRNILLIKFYR